MHAANTAARHRHRSLATTSPKVPGVLTEGEDGTHFFPPEKPSFPKCRQSYRRLDSLKVGSACWFKSTPDSNRRANRCAGELENGEYNSFFKETQRLQHTTLLKVACSTQGLLPLLRKRQPGGGLHVGAAGVRTEGVVEQHPPPLRVDFDRLDLAGRDHLIQQ